jgi:hypothetical protein
VTKIFVVKSDEDAIAKRAKFAAQREVSGCRGETSEKFRRSHRLSSSSSIRNIFDYEVDDEDEDDQGSICHNRANPSLHRPALDFRRG